MRHLPDLGHRTFSSIALAFALVVLTGLASASVTIEGTLYDYYFQPIPGLVSVNTTPAQTVVAPNGTYSFIVEPGVYKITGFSRFNDTTSQVLDASTNGVFRVDLVVIGSTGAEQAYNALNALNGASLPKVNLPPANDGLETAVGIVVLAALVVIVFSVYRRIIPGAARGQGVDGIVQGGASSASPQGGPATQAQPNTQEAHENAKETSSPENQLIEENRIDGEEEIMKVVENEGGIITQKSLRKKLSEWSEARVSMLLSSLESRGLIKKIKKGRGNIIRKS